MSQKKENTSKPTSGKVIRQGKKFSIREASPDDPIYTRGFMVGIRCPRKPVKDTDAASSGPENKEQDKK